MKIIYKITGLIIFNFLNYFIILPFCQSEVDKHLMGNDFIANLYFLVSIFFIIWFLGILIKNKKINLYLILLSLNFFVFYYIFKNLICVGCSLN